MVPKPGELHRARNKKKRVKRTKIEEAVQFALRHHTRLEILILLNETAYTASEVAELTGIDLNNVSNHLQTMFDDGAIEVVKWENRRGTMVYWYRAVEVPEYTKEQAEALTVEELQLIAGVIAQSQTAELMAALHKGTLASPRTILSWDLYDLDDQGREEVEKATEQYLKRLKDAQCDSVNRVAETGVETTPLIVSVAAFERARKILVPRSRSCDPPSRSD